jgi:hypothetical protein
MQVTLAAVFSHDRDDHMMFPDPAWPNASIISVLNKWRFNWTNKLSK